MRLGLGLGQGVLALQQQGGGAAQPAVDPDLSSVEVTPNPFETDASGAVAIALNDADGNPVDRAFTLSPRIARVSGALSLVDVGNVNHPADGATPNPVTIELLNTEGRFAPRFPASRVVIKLNGDTVGVTQPTGTSDESGVLTGSVVTSTTGPNVVTVEVDESEIDDTAEFEGDGAEVPEDLAVVFDTDYADIAAVNADSGASPKTFAVEETVGPWSMFSLQSLPVALGGKKALRFGYPDRTDFTAANGYPIGGLRLRCNDFYIIRALTKFFADNAPVTEVWIEIPTCFSGPLGDPLTAFTTKAPGAWGCASGSDHKTWFLTTNSTRFSYKAGYQGVYYPVDSGIAIPEGPTAARIRYDVTRPGQGDGTYNFIGPNIWDGALHTIRLYAKVDPSGTTGAQKFWIDGVKLGDQSGFQTVGQTQINKLSIGNNLNQGPDRASYFETYHIKGWLSDPGWP